jgi:DNA (cytosine-5)-methyltransferase 1
MMRSGNLSALNNRVDHQRLARDLGMAAANRMSRRGSLLGLPASGPIQVVDLFCGAGGLSAGFEVVGRLTKSFRLVAAVDIDKHSATTYAKNLPIRPIIADLASEASTNSKALRLIDTMGLVRSQPLVLIGGPPCQGFSAHRKKDDKHDDERNKLLMAFARMVALLRPDFVVFENVPEVMAEKNWELFSQMRRGLEQHNYNIRTQIHNLAGFGIPQARFRTLVLAAKKAFRMPEPYVLPRNYHTVRDAIGKLPAIEPGVVSPSDPMHVCSKHRDSTIKTIRKIPKDGGSRPPGVGPRCLQAVDGFRDVYGRLYWDRPANTITAFARNPASGRYIHPEQHRGLSVREAALLQGFPPDYFFEGPFDDKFLQIGNAVPPRFAAFLAAHVFGELTGDQPLNNDLDARDQLGPTSNSFSSGIAGRKTVGRR